MGCPSGFNPIQWNFWGQYLQELSKSDDNEVSDTVEAIKSWWKMIDNHTLGGKEPEGAVKPGQFWVSTQSEN